MNQKEMLIYLASPYTSDSKVIQRQRLQEATTFTSKALLRGWNIFSPVVYSVKLSKNKYVPKEWEFWQQFDLKMLSRCDVLWVLQLPGYSTSVGVSAEIAEARRLGIPVRYFHPNNCP